jgi:hypothetical protein
VFVWRHPSCFLSLVTSVHESYHVFQGLVGGPGCAVVDAEDHFTNALREAVNDSAGNAWTRAGLLSTGIKCSFQAQEAHPEGGQSIRRGWAVERR